MNGNTWMRMTQTVFSLMKMLLVLNNSNQWPLGDGYLVYRVGSESNTLCTSFGNFKNDKELSENHLPKNETVRCECVLISIRRAFCLEKILVGEEEIFQLPSNFSSCFFVLVSFIFWGSFDPKDYVVVLPF